MNTAFFDCLIDLQPYLVVYLVPVIKDKNKPEKIHLEKIEHLRKCETWLHAVRRVIKKSTRSIAQPTPAAIAIPIATSNRTEVTAVTSHSRLSIRNMGKPISRIEPKKSTR